MLDGGRKEGREQREGKRMEGRIDGEREERGKGVTNDGRAGRKRGQNRRR